MVTTNTADPMIGRLIDGRYQVRSRIARGGMATVYLATDLRLERRVAIKVMHGHLADDSQFKERFIQEARSAARLAHPNVVNVFDQGQDSEMAYLVMEYLPGITLRDLLQQHGKLTPEQTLDVLEAVLSGLAAAHKAGIVHRDLKPENVLLADDGRIKIGDFGLARAASANTATGAALLGTIAYLSPELVTRGIADTRSDIYAVGIMMFEMLAGEQPFKGEQPMRIAYQHANDSVPTPSSKNPKVPAELDELVLWATAREPDNRPRDARVMLDQLQDTAHQLQTALPTGSTAVHRTVVMPVAGEGSDSETQILVPQKSRNRTGPIVSDSTAALATISRKRRRRGPLYLLVVLLLAGVAGGVGWYFGTGPGSKSTIPASVVGQSPEQATAAITQLGLAVDPQPGAAYSVEIPAGAVVDTSPPVGSPVTKGETVTLLISQGPEPFPVPLVVGLAENDALALVGEHWTVEDSRRQFDATVARDTVLDILDGNGASLQGVATYLDQEPITLVVSAGSIPDVSALSVADATSVLTGVGLTIGKVEASEFSDTVAEGDVIRAVAQGDPDPLRPGAVMDLVTSKGVEPVEVPDVIDDSWKTAKPLLESLGFVLEYSSRTLVDSAPGSFFVESVSPGVGTQQPKGSTLKLKLGFAD